MSTFQSDTMRQWETSVRDAMEALLSACTDGQQDVFRRMYNHAGKHARSVDAVAFAQFDQAFQQIERTLMLAKRTPLRVSKETQ